MVIFIFYSFLEIMQMFQPMSERTSQKPKPMPSEPPVITAQYPWFCPYFRRWFDAGISYFITSQKKVMKNLRRV
jgi:hypothetical protein